MMLRPYGFLTLLLIGVSLWYAIVYRVNIRENSKALFDFKNLNLKFRGIQTENDMEFNFNYDRLLSSLNIGRSRLPSLPYISGSTLQGLADHIIDREVVSFKPDTFQCGHIVYALTHYVDHFLAHHHQNIPAPYILLTHNSDYPSGRNELLHYLKDPKLIAWYGANLINKHPKLRPIPLGVANEYWNHGNVTILKAVSRRLKPFHQRKTLLYVDSFSETNSDRIEIRQYFLNHFDNDSAVHISRSRKQWKDHMQQLGEAKYVASPPGYGIDCYRTWEALIMGAVPIVERSEFQSLYDNMPVMVVNKWTEVTRENLTKFESTLGLGPDGVPLRPKIWLRYWIEQIKMLRLEFKARNPGCI